MTKKIRIETISPKGKKNYINVKLEGGSPWFGFIWIDNVLFTIHKTSRSYKIKKY